MADKFSMLPTVKFYEIWADSLKKEEDEQWEYMLAESFKAFRSRSHNEQVFSSWKAGRPGSEKELINHFMDSRVYAKISNLRRTFKKKTKSDPPPYPAGRSQRTSSKSIDYAHIARLFKS